MKNMKQKGIKSGFTLIELLVVIAIIGILSSIVLASLNTARSKGADAAIKANLAGIRPQTEIYFDSNGHYGDDASDCTGTAGSIFVIDTTIANAIAQSETVSGGTTATCYADDGVAGSGNAATSWAVSVPLRTDPNNSWCVDSSGVSASGTAIVTGAQVAMCQ